jgi:hypothetical protein
MKKRKTGLGMIGMVDKERSQAMKGNTNASKNHNKFGTASKAIAAFGSPPKKNSGIKRLFLGPGAAWRKYDERVDNYLGHSANKKVVNGAVKYKIATKKSISKLGW